MKTPPANPHGSIPGSRRERGFALVITVCLLVLLTLLALGMLTLSTISLRGNEAQLAQQEARANARVALALAIGEIQRTAGLDTRVTARADILNASNPMVLGVWKSWEGSDHDNGSFAGRPKPPAYGDKQPVSSSVRFLTWLTSWNAEIATQNQTLPATATSAGSVMLLGTGSLGSTAAQANLQINLPPTMIVQTNKSDGLAWWVSGENEKARLPNPANSVYLQNPPSGWTTPENNTPAGWSVNAKTNSTVDTKPFSMDGLLTDPSPVPKAVSLKDADFIPLQATSALKTSQQFFHDLSTTSVGLLTNSATGGWRKDLSLATENLSMLPSSGLPFFRVAPYQDILYSLPSPSNPVPATSMLYPWASYRGAMGIVPIYQLGAVCSWANLFNYATLYKQIPDGPGTINAVAYPDSNTSAAGVYDYIHLVRILPVIARMQWIFSHWAGPCLTNSTEIEPRMVLTPVVTIWNPYNVGVTAPALQFSVMKPLPVALQYAVNGVQSPVFNCLQTGSTNNTPALSTIGTLTYQVNSTITLGPGQTLLFSPTSTTPVFANNNTAIALSPGYRSGGGHYFQILGSNGQPIELPSTTNPASATIQCNARFDTEYLDVAQSPGVGIYLDMDATGTSNRYLAYRMIYPTALADVVYPPINTLASATISQALGSPVPFLTTVFGARMASYTYIPAKGFLQSSPFCNYTAMGGKDVAESTIGVHYYGTDHPVNSPFDYSFEAVTGQSSMLPNTNGNGSGFIVTGFTAADGLSRCVIDELPIRPLCSLAELQNWDIRYDNPIPPFEFNVVGNSDATPLLIADAVYNTIPGNASSISAVNLQYDDFYCANHLLFDDWFCSSIAPDPTGFGLSNGQSLQNVFTSFVNGTAPLANRAYKPIAQDTATAAANSSGASTLYSTQVNTATSWQTIASRIEVEGMFNVNSTSQTAWRALLGHARQQEVAYMSGAGSPTLSSKVDYPFSRFSVAGDSEATSQGSSGLFPDCAQFTGYRVLSSSVIDQLAQNIVAQVRARGPFLSLSEFVNRQLSGSSSQLALAGAIQTALNQLSSSSTNNFYSVLQQNPSYPTSEAPTAIAGNTPEYQFSLAAVGSNGYTSYGVPGWTRQADVLRPIAPILSVRDDTFTIRCYGDARNAAGTIIAKATGEAVVRRVRDYVVPPNASGVGDAADITTTPTSVVNQTFGRHFIIVSFRWLNANEI